ncbi:MAG TPA: nuclear transport factor 2 family protein [Acidimicrobiales bacterium]|nr:nuclear transport factor 2 family protein [Acidimicrobiales bacterium]
MNQQELSAEELAPMTRRALESGDLEGYADILDPNVRWGAPGDAAPPCQNRRQVLEWYGRGREQGRRATVLEVVPAGDKVLVSMMVSTPDEAGQIRESQRWQVLTVGGGLVVDIRGYDIRDQALAAAGISGDAI